MSVAQEQEGGGGVARVRGELFIHNEFAIKSRKKEIREMYI